MKRSVGKKLALILDIFAWPGTDNDGWATRFVCLSKKWKKGLKSLAIKLANVTLL